MEKPAVVVGVENVVLRLFRGGGVVENAEEFVDGAHEVFGLPEGQARLAAVVVVEGTRCLHRPSMTLEVVVIRRREGRVTEHAVPFVDDALGRVGAGSIGHGLPWTRRSISGDMVRP